MLFRPEHVDFILSGRMTQISKLWEKPMAKVGSIHKAKTALFSKDYFASVIITDVIREWFGNITLEYAIREGYDDLQGYIEAWRKKNGYWEPNTIVHVVSFALKESFSPSTEATTITGMQTCEGEIVRTNCAH